MTQSHVEGAALVAMLVSLPLVSWGTTSDITAATAAGAILLAVGLATLTVLRFVDLEEGA
jgi:ABC-type sulfate transport system permease component